MTNNLEILGLIILTAGLFQIIKLLRQIRILNSMTLKTILKMVEKQGVEIDISAIQKEVLEKL